MVFFLSSNLLYGLIGTWRDRLHSLDMCAVFHVRKYHSRCRRFFGSWDTDTPKKEINFKDFNGKLTKCFYCNVTELIIKMQDCRLTYLVRTVDLQIIVKNMESFKN